MAITGGEVVEVGATTLATVNKRHTMLKAQLDTPRAGTEVTIAGNETPVGGTPTAGLAGIVTLGAVQAAMQRRAAGVGAGLAGASTRGLAEAPVAVPAVLCPIGSVGGIHRASIRTFVLFVKGKRGLTPCLWRTSGQSRLYLSAASSSVAMALAPSSFARSPKATTKARLSLTLTHNWRASAPLLK
jgi:hypothetical protein